MNDARNAESFLARSEALRQRHPAALSPLGAALVTAAGLGIATDTRSFSRRFGVPHALLLREVLLLSERDGFVEITGRDARTLRTRFVLTPLGVASLVANESALRA